MQPRGEQARDGERTEHEGTGVALRASPGTADARARAGNRRMAP